MTNKEKIMTNKEKIMTNKIDTSNMTAKQKDIVRLFSDSNMLESQKKVINNLFSTLKNDKIINKAINDLLEDQNLIEQVIIPVYSKYYTHAEIKDLISIYGKPVMKKSIENNEIIIKDMSQKMQKILSDNILKQLPKEMGSYYQNNIEQQNQTSSDINELLR